MERRTNTGQTDTTDIIMLEIRVSLEGSPTQRELTFFSLAKFSDLAKRNFQRAKNMRFFGFLTATFLQ
jgi:hypothetical protein